MTDNIVRRMELTHERFAVAGSFRISRSAVTEIDVLTVHLREEGHVGRGECRPYPRYGESCESVMKELNAVREQIERAPTNDFLSLCRSMPAGAASNALESACVDLVCKQSGKRAWDMLGCQMPEPRVTAYTLSVDQPEAMANAAKAAGDYPLLKVKVSAALGAAQIAAVSAARPDARFIVDANEALDAPGLLALCAACPDRVIMIEQPMPAGAALPSLPENAPPICADESLHGAGDLQELRAAGFGAINVKLDKAGGPVRALELIRAGKAEGMLVMAGCMVGTSLAMAPMVAISMEADVLDLDGPLLLSEDRAITLPYDGPRVGVPPRPLWG